MIVITGDWHLHPFRSYNTITKEGFNSRLWEQVSVIMAVVNYANENNADYLIHLGDVFHAQGESLNKDAMRAAHILLDKIAANKIIVPGNHDVYRNKTVFRPFKGVAEIVTQPTVYHIDGQDFGMIPHRRYKKQFVEDLEKVRGADVLCCHQLFTNTVIRDGAYVKAGEMLPLELVKDFKLVLGGHNHKPHNVGNLWHVGAPMQMNHADESQERGFVVYNKGDISFIPIAGPNFHTADIDSEEEMDLFNKHYSKSNYYRVRVNSELDLNLPLGHRVDVMKKRKKTKVKRLVTAKKSVEDIIVEVANDDDLAIKAIELWKETEE